MSKQEAVVAVEPALCYIPETSEEWAVLVLPERNIGRKGPLKCYENETFKGIIIHNESQEAQETVMNTIYYEGP